MGDGSEEERGESQSVRGDTTKGLNTKTSVSSRKYPPVRVIANTRLCVMSRTVGEGCVSRCIYTWVYVYVCVCDVSGGK